jgi:hypothetical protein
MSDDDSSIDGGNLFQEPTGYYKPEQEPTSTTFALKDGRTVSLRLVGHSPLWVRIPIPYLPTLMLISFDRVIFCGMRVRSLLLFWRNTPTSSSRTKVYSSWVRAPVFPASLLLASERRLSSSPTIQTTTLSRTYNTTLRIVVWT